VRELEDFDNIETRLVRMPNQWSRRGDGSTIRQALSVRSRRSLLGLPLMDEAEPVGYKRCVCGKLCFPSEQAAKGVVFETRIARAVRHNNRRKEDRHYQCYYGAWHTTSLAHMNAPTRVL
jgi:hypothetical protein